MVNIEAKSSTDSTREHELKLTVSTRRQVKLLGLLRGQGVEDIVHMLRGVLGIGDFVVRVEDIKSLIDHYFDTEDLALYHTHSVVRIRLGDGQPCLVIKKLMGQDQGELERTEHETRLSHEAYQDLLDKGLGSVVAVALPDIESRGLDYKLKVSNERRNYLLDRQDERYRLSLDLYVYYNPKNGRTSGQQFELEIEALNGAASDKLRGMKHHMLEVLREFEFSKGSKYERGIRLFCIDKAEWKQVIAAWNSGTGLGLLSVGVSIASLILGLVLGIMAR